MQLTGKRTVEIDNFKEILKQCCKSTIMYKYNKKRESVREIGINLGKRRMGDKEVKEKLVRREEE